MKKTRLLFFAALATTAFNFSSCSDDDKPTFNIPTTNIDGDAYTMGGSLRLLYSIDNGANYSATVPANIGENVHVFVKLNNGTTDLTTDDFDIDWTGSSPAPTAIESGVAEFVVSANIAVQVTVTDKMTLVTSHRANGKFFAVNPSTGALTEAFTPMYADAALTSVRGFVYHYKKGLYYASLNTDKGGYLYTINPSTKVATRINENNGANGAAVWDAVVNWAVAADDSLIAIGDFNGDGNGVVKFGTDGGRSAKTAQADICCALGMLYDAAAGEFQIANGENANEGEVIIDRVTNAGVFVGESTAMDLVGFSDDFSSDYIYLRTMAKSPAGEVYGTLYSSEFRKTYFVKINIASATITYVATLGENNENQYNSLAFIPNYTL